LVARTIREHRLRDIRPVTDRFKQLPHRARGTAVNQRFADTIRQVFNIRVITDILKRQHRDGINCRGRFSEEEEITAKRNRNYYDDRKCDEEF